MNVVENITIEELENLNKNRIPTLIKNGIKHFPNLQKWNKEYIINKYGNMKCNYSYHDRPVRSEIQTNYSNFFHNLDKNTYTFTRKLYNSNDYDFIQDFTFPNSFFVESNIDKRIFYSGPKNTGALPHSHTTALNFMIYGKKKWIFFDTITPVGKNLENYYYQQYPIDVKYNDWYKLEYNQLKNTIPIIECIQEPYDVVFIPNMYNHSVYNLEETMGIVIELKK